MKLLLFLCICIALAIGRDLREYFPPCQYEPDVEICLLRTLERVRPRLKYGIPELGIPALDPYTLDQLDIDTALNLLKIKCRASNIIVNGASDFRIPYFKIDSRTYAFEMKIVLPYVSVTADYDTEGTKVFIVTLNGRGKFNGNFNGITTTIRGLSRPIVKDGVEVLNIESLATVTSFGHSDITVTPLKSSFTGSLAARYINARPAAIMEKLAPVIDDNISPILKEYLNSLLEAMSKDRLIL